MSGVCKFTFLRQFKQQRQQRQRQCRLKNDFIFNPGISREFKFIQFVYHCHEYAKQNMSDSGKIQNIGTQGVQELFFCEL